MYLGTLWGTWVSNLAVQIICILRHVPWYLHGYLGTKPGCLIILGYVPWYPLRYPGIKPSCFYHTQACTLVVPSGAPGYQTWLFLSYSGMYPGGTLWGIRVLWAYSGMYPGKIPTERYRIPYKNTFETYCCMHLYPSLEESSQGSTYNTAHILRNPFLSTSTTMAGTLSHVWTLKWILYWNTSENLRWTVLQYST